MNTVIEPCCYSKQLTHNLELAEKGGGVSHFFSFSDWSTDELLPWFFGSVPGCEAVVSLVQIDFRTIYVLQHLMGRTYYDREAGETRPVVGRLTLITQPSRTDADAQRRELRAQLGKYIDEGRVVVCEDSVAFRCLAAGNGIRHLVLQGSINQSHMEPCTQMFTLTTTKGAWAQAMEMLRSKGKTKHIKL